ncbi:autotransporter assembly complex protein TamA [Alteromonas lipotrueiana]|uniref:autotransporter assembly complex protein TamA n=1 Tax=Alteromonas lipotrueiana TaxID=2803815 RepID=UPI001FE52F5D|nr:autotransporter assembly complex family protein [Alteromonas lipotrueiana]
MMLTATAGFSGAALAELSFEIEGVEDGKLEDNIRTHLNNLEVSKKSLNDPFWREQVNNTVATAVEPFGYYNSETLIEQTDEDDEVILKVSLDTPLKIANVTREIIGPGRNDHEFRQVFDNFALEPGDTLLQPVYESFKSRMFNYALSHGYFDFQWQATRLDLVREEREANILLIAQSGPQYQFGPIKLVGDDRAESIIKRLKPFDIGQPYSSKALTQFNRELNQAGYFSRVIARPVVSEAQGLQVPIEITVNHKPRDNFNVGLGAATDTGPRARLKWQRPWVNEAGHSAAAELFISAPEQSITAEYLVPMGDIKTDYLKYEAGYQFLDYSETNTESQTLSLSVHRIVQEDDSPWQDDYSLTYLREQYKVENDPTQTTQLVMPGYSIQYLQKDDPLNISNGNLFRTGFQVGREGIGSDIDIFKAVAEARIIRTYNKHRLMIRAETGFMETSNFGEVPASLRFYAGGDQSIRGFGYRAVGPEGEIFDPATGTSESAGGKYLATMGFEYAYQVAENWRAAAFIDVGTATNELEEDPAYGVGPGVHWLSPIGPVRLYVARGFSPEENTWRIHFMLGPEL